MLRDSVVVAVVIVVVVVRTRPRAIPLATRKSTHGFHFLLHDKYGAPLGGPFGPPELRYQKRMVHGVLDTRTAFHQCT